MSWIVKLSTDLLVILKRTGVKWDDNEKEKKKERGKSREGREMGRKLKRKSNKRQIKQIFERQTGGNGKENEKKKGQGN
jgi:hypothetical protein